MKEYEKTKSTLSESDQAAREEGLEFRRMKIKKQMLGNIKVIHQVMIDTNGVPHAFSHTFFAYLQFIGELYKLGMLKEKIMRFCIQSLLKLEEVEGADYIQFRNIEDDDMDEEDHEALCNLFTTVSLYCFCCTYT